MQSIKQESYSISDANKELEVDLTPNMWSFIVRMINYPELSFDADKNTIEIDGYVPFKELAKEWITSIQDGTCDARKCEECGSYFDLNSTDGIFGNPEELEEFICYPCAESMTARAYYERFVERQG